jgi:hypothetical protein
MHGKRVGFTRGVVAQIVRAIHMRTVVCVGCGLPVGVRAVHVRCGLPVGVRAVHVRCGLPVGT